MKNILYYLEPAIEMGDPFFRMNTFKSIVLPQLKELKNADNTLNIKLIVGKHIFNEAKTLNIDTSFLELISISTSEINKIYENHLQISIDWVMNNNNEVILKKMGNLILNKLKNFIPDIVISYESPIPFMKYIFPNALILHEMFGAFSRAPFPSMATIDSMGIFLNSSQVFYNKKLNNEKLSPEEEKVLFDFRRAMMKSIAQNLPLKSFIDDIHSKFDAVILIACQIDGYYAYDAHASFGSQFETSEYVLKNTAANIAVIVTNHGYKKQFSQEQLQYLSNTYSNFVFFENKQGIPNVSQFLIPYVDGVASVSSSVAYQAALWRKPYFALGNSQVSIFAYSSSIEKFLKGVSALEHSNKDCLLYNIMAYLNLGYKQSIFNGKEYIKILKSKYKQYNKGQFLELPIKKNVQEMRTMLLEHSRPWLLFQDMKKFSNQIAIDHLRVSMSECLVGSFDLFDTLAERDFCEPHELFLFIEPKVQKFLNNKNFKYHYFRRQAEVDARRVTNGEFEVTLDQIYEKMIEITGLKKDEIRSIKKIEIAAELALVHPKMKMVREYNFSKTILKNRCIITDTYLPKITIFSILQKIGISDYSDVYVSSDTKTRKHNGTIFIEYLQKVKNLYQINPERILHIGDNEIADGQMAKKHGIKTYIFPKAIDNYKKSLLGKTMISTYKQGGISSSIINGIFANKFYSAHWSKINQKSLFCADPQVYGYTVIGPLVLGFSQWLYRRASFYNIENLYFLSRDGWLLKKAYDYLYGSLTNAPKSHYLYCSRRSVMVASIKNKECIYEIAAQNFNAKSLASFLENRFGLIWDNAIENTAKKYNLSKNYILSPLHEQAKFKKFLDAIYPIILKNAEKEKNGYLNYLNSIGFIKSINNKNTAVVDIGYSGSMQLYLKKLLNANKLGGFYFLTHHHSRDFFNHDIFEGFLANLDDHYIGLRHPLNEHVFLFESALSSMEGSLLFVENSGSGYKMHFMDAQEESRRRYLVMKMHQGAEDFFRFISNRFNDYRFDFGFSPLLSSSLIFKFANDPSGIDASMFLNFEVENSFGGGSVSLIADIIGKSVNNDNVVKYLIELSKWKNGAAAYYNFLKKQTISISPNNIKETKKIPVEAGDTLNKTIAQNIRNKKLAKFKRNPYAFFNDSKKPIIKKCAIIFDTKHKFGQIMSSVIKKII
ncbi:MAG: hypothetical protein LBD84_00900 [Campylobacteraceae bacterium]|jgi:predicted HAD superfamily hydrolase|nr:hypothetical protein [Campylobacteraceae bacterium]